MSPAVNTSEEQRDRRTHHEIDEMHEKLALLKNEIRKVYFGNPDRVELALVTVFAGGHLIIEDVPGVGKTVLAKTIARAMEGKFRRIQFTPDLLPSDVLGVTMYNEEEKEFVFKKGPIFANIVLADEINRTTPRTQSSLLEAMNSYQVTIDGVSHPLPRPFCLLATQNPFDFEGTYPLPESQLDRFFLRIDLGYPDAENARRIILSQKLKHPVEDVKPVVSAKDVCLAQQLVRRVHVSDVVVDYILEIVERTRSAEDVTIGVSPRGGVHLYRAAQALALLRGRSYCEPDDVKQLAIPVLSHRMRCRAGNVSGGSFDVGARTIRGILDNTPVPV